MRPYRRPWASVREAPDLQPIVIFFVAYESGEKIYAQYPVRRKIDVDVREVDVLGLVLRVGVRERIDLHEHLLIRLLLPGLVEQLRALVHRVRLLRAFLDLRAQLGLLLLELFDVDAGGSVGEHMYIRIAHNK
jgi:hypothetical protein